jgi:hypothetical protein
LQGYSGEERLKKIGEIWERIYTIFGLISEWYEDQELYHYVGYLMCTESSSSKRLTLLCELLGKQRRALRLSSRPLSVEQSGRR